MLNFKIINPDKGKNAIVFLHGFLVSITRWGYLPIINLDCPAMLIDLPGHGKSILEDDSFPNLDFYASEVSTLLNELDYEITSLVGHSMGGYVSLLLKERYFSLSSLVLLNSNFWSDSEQKKKDRVRVADIVLKNKNLFIKEAISNLFIDPKLNNDKVQKMIHETSCMDSFSISYASLAMRDRKDFSQSKILSNDVLIIQGEKDKTVICDEMKKKCQDLKVELEIIDEVGHMAHIENSLIVFDLIQKHFSKHFKC